MEPTPPSCARPAIAASIALCAALAALGGCANLESRLHEAQPGNRVELGWQDRIDVSSRDAAKYTCGGRYTLRCDGGGAITLSCTCVLR